MGPESTHLIASTIDRANVSSQTHTCQRHTRKHTHTHMSERVYCETKYGQPKQNPAHPLTYARHCMITSYARRTDERLVPFCSPNCSRQFAMQLCWRASTCACVCVYECVCIANFAEDERSEDATTSVLALSLNGAIPLTRHVCNPSIHQSLVAITHTHTTHTYICRRHNILEYS